MPRALHEWWLSPKEAVELQKRLYTKVIARGAVRPRRWVAGVDVAYREGGARARAVVVLCRWPEMEVIEERVAEEQVRFPYVPGLLGFREAPAALAALSKLSRPIDCLLVDGQGQAHPRRFGLACHLGLWIDRPTIGCAKSRLHGRASSPGPEKGSTSPLLDADGEVLGAAVTTRDHCKPLYVSVGHRVSLEAAVEVVLACCQCTKHPEPLRLADRLSKAHDETSPYNPHPSDIAGKPWRQNA